MTPTNRSFVVAYILLVGLPVLGLLGILRMGRTLAPPLSVNGTWKLEADGARIATLRCSSSGFSAAIPSLLISQSGMNLLVTLNSLSKIAAPGAINGKLIKASLAPALIPENVCGTDRTVTLTATLDPQADPRTLNGTLAIEGCGSCPIVEFDAVRQPRSLTEGAH